MTSLQLSSSSSTPKQIPCASDLQAWFGCLLIVCFFFASMVLAGATLMRSQSVQSVSWFMYHYVPCHGALLLSLGCLLCPSKVSSSFLWWRLLLLLGLSPFLTWSFVLENNTYMTICSWGWPLAFLSVIRCLYKAMKTLGQDLGCLRFTQICNLCCGCFRIGMVAPFCAFVCVTLIYWVNHGIGKDAIAIPNIYSLASILGKLEIGKWLFIICLIIFSQLTVLTGWLCIYVHGAARKECYANQEQDTVMVSEAQAEKTAAPSSNTNAWPPETSETTN